MLLGSQDEASLHFFMSFDKIQFNSEMTFFLLGFFLKKMCISSWEITIFLVIQLLGTKANLNNFVAHIAKTNWTDWLKLQAHFDF